MQTTAKTLTRIPKGNLGLIPIRGSEALAQKINDSIISLGKNTISDVGTGGMSTKIHAAQIATEAGVDMVISNGNDFHNIHRIAGGSQVGTLFLSEKTLKKLTSEGIS